MILENKKISKMILVILYIILLGGVLVFATLPFCLKWFLEFKNMFELNYFVKTLSLLYTSGTLALIILFKTITLFNSINISEPFSKKNAKTLSVIGWCSLAISLLYLIFFPMIKSVFMIIIFMTFTIFGFMTIVLSEFVYKAIKYKEENDLMI
ncbi:MAG: DUF2975 domain-containing protein [Clostridia bacterium]